MKLIWTYNSNIKVRSDDPLSIFYPSVENTNKRKIITINYYLLSIKNAKKLGYETIIYTDNDSSKYFKGIVDEIVLVSDYEASPLFDSFKFKVLEDRSDDFCLIDGDLILHSKLPTFTSEVTFDSYEKNSWSNVYEKTINTLTELGISKVINFWSNNKTDIMCCGLLSFNNEKIKRLYLGLWKEFNIFIKNNQDSIDLDFATAIGAQYLLTLLLKKHNINYSNMSNELGKINEYYHHHNGDLKYKTPIVADSYIVANGEPLKLI